MKEKQPKETKKPKAPETIPPPLPDMPTLTKHGRLIKEILALNGFLEWLEEQELTICSMNEGSNRLDYNPIMERAENLALRYLEIDPRLLEADRQKLIDWQAEHVYASEEKP